MKIAAVICALIGVLACLALGMKWISDYNQFKDTISGMQELAAKMGGDGKMDESLAQLASIKNAAYIMIIGALASLGGIVLLFKKPIISSIIFDLAFILPLLFTGKSLPATLFLGVAGILALLVAKKNSAASNITA